MFPDRKLGPRARFLFLAASLVLVTWQLPALAQSADPSDRIATVTDAAGNLSFAPAGSDDWAQAALNRPITTGDRLWVDNGGRAELHAGSTAIRLGSGTAVTVLNLDDSATQVKLTQGTLQLRARALPPDQPVEIDTPNLAFVPREPGDYRLDVAPDGSSTVVTMHHGSATLYGDNRSLEMRRGEQVRFGGTDLAEAGSATNPPMDGFDRWTMARDAREDRSPSARYVAPEMTGYAALDDYGDWQEDPGYGAVWFPRVVAADWVPYSAGYWAWVAPWGWSWCDDAPWGFAPSHYGRWARVGNRWGWMPGPRSVQPVYAPALVGFIDGGHWRDHDHDRGHDRGNGPGVAWYPLGPREAYRPVYGASPAYVNRINHFTVNNEVINNHIRNTYINRDVPGAITGMPARAFVQGQRVPPGARGVAWRNLPRGEANGAPPLAPVKASLQGAAPARPAPAEIMQGFARPAIAARAPGRPASDELAQRFARAGGTVPGAGPAWRGGGNAPGGNQAAPAPVRLSQAAPEFHGRNGAGQMRGGPVTPGAPGGGNPAFGPQRAEGGVRAPTPQGLVGAEHGGQVPVPGGDPRTRGWTTRPDQARGMPPQNGQPAAQLQQAQQAQQGQQAQQFQQRQAEQRAAAQQNGRTLQTDPQGMARQQQERQMGDQQRAQQALQQQQDMQRQQQQRQTGDQQRAQQALQQQQDMQRQQQQRQTGDQQRAQQALQQQQDMQRQQQQRQMGDQQRAQQPQQQQQDMQRQQQQRQMADQQRAQQALQQQQELQRQQQQRQAGDQQRAQQAVQQQQDMQRQQQQRQAQDQQRAQQAVQQQQDMQRQQQQRQAQDQQRAQQAMQQQQDMQRQQQRQMQEQQRQQQAIQQQAMQRQQQEQQRQQQQQQQQQQEQQRQQQVMQRQQQDQQRQQQEQQRQQQDQQRQQQEQQRRQQELQRQQQHAAQPQSAQHVAMQQQPHAQGQAGNPQEHGHEVH